MSSGSDIRLDVYPPPHDKPYKCLAINMSVTRIIDAAIARPAKYELNSDWRVGSRAARSLRRRGESAIAKMMPHESADLAPGAGGRHDRGPPCPVGPTRNSANLLPCGRQIRLRKLPNSCTAGARRYAGRQSGCARRDCCRTILPSISTSIRQSGGRQNKAWVTLPHRPAFILPPSGKDAPVAFWRMSDP